MIDIFMLVHNRREFTEIALEHLYRNTNFDLVNRLVFVDDMSVDGAAEACQERCDRHGIGEVCHVQGGSVTNALHYGVKPYLADDIKYLVKLDNDIVVCPRWLDIMFKVIEDNEDCERCAMALAHRWQHVRATKKYRAIPHMGCGNFIMRWEKYKRVHPLGVTKDPETYMAWSLGRIWRRLYEANLVSFCKVAPRMPIHQIGEMPVKKRYLEHLMLDRDWVISKVNEYHKKGWVRRYYKDGERVHDHTFRDPHTTDTLEDLLEQYNVKPEDLCVPR